MIDADALTDWLDNHLGRGELSVRLRDIISDESLDDDTRLLHFTRLLLPQDKMPAVWRGEVITREVIASRATTALQGDQEALAWLYSLCDGRCFSFYSPINEDIRRMDEELSGGIRSYREAWREMVNSGAPEEAMPDESSWIAEVALLTFSKEAARALRNSAANFFEPATLLSRSGWYFTFGSDLQAMSIYQLRVLEVLETVSLLDEVNTDSFDDRGNVDEDSLRNRLVVPEWQRRLVQGLIIRPGSEVVSLEQGGRHRSRDPNTFPEHVAEFLLRTLDAMRERWRDRSDEQAAAEPETQTDPAIEVRARLVRVTADFALPDESIINDEYYLALFNWQAPDDHRVSFQLNELGWGLRPTILKVRNLPQSGQLQMLLYKGCYATVSAKRRWYLPALKTQPIRVYIDDVLKLTDRLQKLFRRDVVLAKARSTTYRLHEVSASRQHLHTARTQLATSFRTLEKSARELDRDAVRGFYQSAKL